MQPFKISFHQHNGLTSILYIVPYINRSFSVNTTEWIYHHLFIHQLKDMWVVSSLGNYNENSYEHAHTDYFMGMFLFFWARYPHVGLLGHVVSVVSTYKRLSNCFPE